MSHQLHVDTAVLRWARVVTEGLCTSLRPDALDPVDLAALTGLPGGAALVAGHGRLLDAVSATVRELTELDAALGAAATALEGAERDAVQATNGIDR